MSKHISTAKIATAIAFAQSKLVLYVQEEELCS